MNTGHTHNEGDLYADDIHDAEFQDAEIIDEEIHEHATTAPQQETAAVQEEPQVVEPQAQENIDIQFNDNPAEFAQRQAQAERQASDAEQADEAISILEGELHKEKDKYMRLFA